MISETIAPPPVALASIQVTAPVAAPDVNCIAITALEADFLWQGVVSDFKRGRLRVTVQSSGELSA